MFRTSASKTLLFAACGWAAFAGAVAAQDPDRVVALEEIIVTGTPFGVTDRASLIAVDVLDAEELAVAPVATLGDLVAGVPGVRSSSFAPGASRPVIRGLSGPRVQVLTNGLGLIDASSVSPDHQVAVDPAEASRIEIVRGPSTLVFGGSAIGGVVNIVDDRVPTTRAEGGLDGHVSGQGSTVDDGYGLGARLKANAGSFVFALDGFTRDSGDYAIPGPAMSQRLADQLGVPRGDGGTVANSFARIDQAGAGLSWVDEGGFAGLSVKTTDSTYGVVVEDAVTIQLEQTRYDFRAERDIHGGPFSRLRLALGAADYRHVEFEGPDVGTTFTSNGFEGRGELIQTQRGGWQGVIGGQVLNRLFDAIGDEAYVPRTGISEAGIYTVQRYDRGPIGFEGGLRLDRRDLSTAPVDRTFQNVSASMGAFVRPARGLFVGLSLARNARAPTEVELFAAGPHVATAAFELGDPGFDSEVAYSLEGTAHYDSGRLTLDLHPYAARYDGFIDIRPTGAVDADSGLPVFAYRQTDAEFYGLETEGAYTLWQDGDRSLAIEGEGDYVHADTDLGPAARIPPWSATARLAWTSRLFDAALEARRVGRQEDVAPFELPTDAYTMVNLTGAVRPFRDRNVIVFAEARNLTDAEAREHASFLKDIAPLPGRNLRVGVTYRF